MQQSDPLARTMPQHVNELPTGAPVRNMPGSIIMQAGGLRQVLIQKAAQREMLSQSTPVFLCGPSAGPMQAPATMVHPSAQFVQRGSPINPLQQRASPPLVHPAAPQQVLLGLGCPPVVSAGANQLSDSMVHAVEAPVPLADPMVSGSFQRSDSLVRSSARLEALLKAPRPSANPDPTPCMQDYYGEVAAGIKWDNLGGSTANTFVWDNLGASQHVKASSRLPPQAAPTPARAPSMHHLQQPFLHSLPASSAVLKMESLGSGPRAAPTHHPELVSNSPPLAWQQAVEQAIQAGLLPPPAAKLQEMRANDVYERGLVTFPTVG